MHLELDDTETQTLREILEAELPKLMVESSRTDTHDYRVKLQHKREAVERLLERLGGRRTPRTDTGSAFG